MPCVAAGSVLLSHGGVEIGQGIPTKALQAANVRVSTGAPAHGTTSLCRRRLLINLLGVAGTAGYGQDPSAGDQQAWPVFPLTINPSLLRSDNATLVAAFAEALQAAAADNKL